MLHRFATSVDHLPLPQLFTFPFCYTPHPLCLAAAAEVQQYLKHQEAWSKELNAGKMFGVLVVQTADGSIGYLAAFSGILAGSNKHSFFVPPVYDLLQPDGFFKLEEHEISQINVRIKQLEDAPSYQSLRTELADLKQQASYALEQTKLKLKAAKAQREARRKEATLSPELALTPEEEAALIRESQFMKADYKRQERNWNEQIETLQQKIDAAEHEVHELKRERKQRSAALQQRLFEQFVVLNARGEKKDLCQLFAETLHHTPPAGAGECAAPKLLQQAYLHQWKPIAMAEFWWGQSPKNEIRQHGHYYPACKSKCEPILKFMLQGLQVEDNPMVQRMQDASQQSLNTCYEDDWLVVVNKPAGMLSVPGKEKADSVESLMRKRYPQAQGPLIVHRLDMATSGLLLIAKTKEVHQHLQAQFQNRQVEKRYIAILDGEIGTDSGIIELPLCLDPDDRPRQRVDSRYGKPATTRYKVLERTNGRTRIAFYPLTGRTHQLRVHAAHALGLHTPIVGDELYGKKADRLYLHAEKLVFIHPVSGKTIRVEEPCPF